MHKQNCCSTPSGVCLLTIMGFAYGDVVFQMIPASSKFLISCFKKSWCLSAKGYGKTIIWAASCLVAMCIL